MNKLQVAICIPAYNEAQNIKKLLGELLRQKTKRIKINKIVVVASGCTDKTPQIVKKIAAQNSIISLIYEKKRTGKAAAINEFLKTTHEEIIVLESADTVPSQDTIEKLCVPFLEDSKIGMTGGAPIPVNDPDTFLGYIIHAWWWFHRNIPRFGEIIAYRNILPRISATTAVDEAYIQAKIIQKGYKVVHIDDAIVYNKGAATLKDLIKQRRRVFNGHSRLFKEEKIKISNMTKSSVKLLLFSYQIKSVKHLFWLFGGILVEIYARILGTYDTYIVKINPYAWEVAYTTKDISDVEITEGEEREEG